MKYSGTLIAVRDMETAKRFYRDLFGLKPIADFGANVSLEGGIYLQTLESWKDFIAGQPVTLGANDAELYFETNDLDAFLNLIEKMEIQYVHPPLTHSWGQRCVRIYDPDEHILEIAEEIGSVVQRFLRQGLTPEETALRMDVPLDFIKHCL